MRDQGLKASADGGAPKNGAPSSKKDRRPTPDQMYLAEKLNAAHADEAPKPPRIFIDGEEQRVEFVKPYANAITPAALQKWNLVYGVAAVSDAMRTAWGFPPLGGIENPFAYVQGILRGAK